MVAAGRQVVRRSSCSRWAGKARARVVGGVTPVTTPPPPPAGVHLHRRRRQREEPPRREEKRRSQWKGEGLKFGRVVEEVESRPYIFS